MGIQRLGRCKVLRRAEVETLAATLTSLRRTVAVTAFPRAGLARVPAAEARLNAMHASTSHAALAVKTPEGKCASADAFMPEFVCSMIAWWRWVLSASTVIWVLMVKNAWKRNRSNRVPWPVATVLFSSGMRRTTSRPMICSFVFFDPNAVKAISATSASEIHHPVVSSKMALVYLIGVQAVSGMVLMAAFTSEFIRAVIETIASARIAAFITALT